MGPFGEIFLRDGAEVALPSENVVFVDGVTEMFPRVEEQRAFVLRCAGQVGFFPHTPFPYGNVAYPVGRAYVFRGREMPPYPEGARR